MEHDILLKPPKERPSQKGIKGSPGRPTLDGDKRISRGFLLHPDTIKKLKELSQKLDSSMGRIIDELVDRSYC